MSGGGHYRFGPFSLDPRAQQLRRGAVPIPLPDRQFHLLHALVSRAGELVTKQQLLEAAWPNVAVNDNSLVKAMGGLREWFEADGLRDAILTEHGHGYRFAVPVATGVPREPMEQLEARLTPHYAFVEGRAALESLSRDSISEARATFTALLTQHADDPRVHVGLANACILSYEATRAVAAPDLDALRTAAHHSLEACQLSPDDGEVWATRGFVLERHGDRARAVAALERAVALEPQNWRHHLRLASATWGEARLRAAQRTLALLPGCPMAHLLAAMVFVARNALAHAERAIDAGLIAMAGEAESGERFSSVALHWLKGLLLLARGDDQQAQQALLCELALESRGHLYARECAASAWYALGVCRLRAGLPNEARQAFEQAIVRVPRHPMAHAGLAIVGGGAWPAAPSDAPESVDAALARAALHVSTGDVPAAVHGTQAALSAAAPGNAGWLVPVDPLLSIGRHLTDWAPVLAALRRRAS